MKYSKLMANLYHYDKDVRKEISGFSRLEIQEDTLKIGIKLCFSKLECGQIKVYIITQKGVRITGELIREEKMRQRVFTMQMVLTKEKLEEMNVCVNDIKGVMLVFSDTRKYLSMWEKEDIKISNIIIEEKIVMQESISKEEQEEENIYNCEVESLKKEENEKEQEKNENCLKEDCMKEQCVKENCEKEDCVEENCTQLNKGFEKVNLMELRKLPKSAWMLGNNSFLLHGYYNYHFIYLKKEPKRWIIGVPGVYHTMEKKAAEFFGFNQFIPENDEEVKNDCYGFWCRVIEVDNYESINE